MRLRDETIPSYPDARSAVRFEEHCANNKDASTRQIGMDWGNVELIQHQAMQGDEWKGCYKYRVGDYRIIYQMEHPATKLIVKLIVLKVGHRREVYK